MNATKSLKRSHQDKLEIVELLNILRDVTVKQKQAVVLQRLELNRARAFGTRRA